LLTQALTRNFDAIKHKLIMTQATRLAVNGSRFPVNGNGKIMRPAAPSSPADKEPAVVRDAALAERAITLSKTQTCLVCDTHDLHARPLSMATGRLRFLLPPGNATMRKQYDEKICTWELRANA
jgi:hypothetical protein